MNNDFAYVTVSYILYRDRQTIMWTFFSIKLPTYFPYFFYKLTKLYIIQRWANNNVNFFFNQTTYIFSLFFYKLTKLHIIQSWANNNVNFFSIKLPTYFPYFYYKLTMMFRTKVILRRRKPSMHQPPYTCFQSDFEKNAVNQIRDREAHLLIHTVMTVIVPSSI